MIFCLAHGPDTFTRIRTVRTYTRALLRRQPASVRERERAARIPTSQRSSARTPTESNADADVVATVSMYAHNSARCARARARAVYI